MTPPTGETPNAALLVVVHEHQWIGGRCIHGCREERPVEPKHRDGD